MEKKLIVEQCRKDGKTCSRVAEDGTCSAYLYPAAKWRIGCPLADDFLKAKETSTSNGKKRVGQQKQKKGKK